MGHDSPSTIIYVGLARLPQPLAATVPALAVELEVEPGTRRIASVHTSLPFPALQRLLQDVLCGHTLDELAGRALLELEVRYASPFTTAVRAALLAAIRRTSEETPIAPSAIMERVALSSA
jgi:hypothetical protein